MLVDVRLTPMPVEFWIVPPEALLVPPPSPATMSPPLEPVVLRTIPLAAPLAEMAWNVTLLDPIVVLAMFSAVPVVVVRVFAAPVTLTTPPFVAVNALFAPVPE